MLLPIRKELLELRHSAHGGINHQELMAYGLDVENVLDFSVCTNPYMPPLELLQTIVIPTLRRYPDTKATVLRERLSVVLNVPQECIIAGNGTTELIRLIALSFLERRDVVVIEEPTYGEYEEASQLYGATICRVRAVEKDCFVPDIGRMIVEIKRCQPKLVFICNPNNPTGCYITREAVESIAAEMKNGVLVLDEAYVQFIKDAWDSTSLIEYGNVVILRSMTKSYGLAGVRLGYALGMENIIDILEKAKPPWSVNGVAQALGLACLGYEKYLKKSILMLRDAVGFLQSEFTKLGYVTLPTATNYFLMKVPDAAKFRLELLQQGILVRDCTSFGLPNYVRIAAHTIPECTILIKEVEAYKNKVKE